MSFSETVTSLFTSKHTNLSCSTLTANSSPPQISQVSLPSQPLALPTAQKQQFLTCFLHRLVLLALEGHINGSIQKVFFCVRFISLSIMHLNTKRWILNSVWAKLYRLVFISLLIPSDVENYNFEIIISDKNNPQWDSEPSWFSMNYSSSVFFPGSRIPDTSFCT